MYEVLCFGQKICPDRRRFSPIEHKGGLKIQPALGNNPHPIVAVWFSLTEDLNE